MFLSKSAKNGFMAALAAFATVPGAYGGYPSPICEFKVVNTERNSVVDTFDVFQHEYGGIATGLLEYHSYETVDINIVAVPCADGNQVNSVRVTADDNNSFRAACETRSPYSVYGDSPPGGADVSIGETNFNSVTVKAGETITATPFSSGDCSYGEGETATLKIEEAYFCKIEDFYLYDADTDSEIGRLPERFCEEEGSGKFNIKGYHYSGCTFQIESVKFELFTGDGNSPIAKIYDRVENGSPYMLFGDSGGDIYDDNDMLTYGTYTVKATTYTGNGATGFPGPTTQKTFAVSPFCDRRQLRGKEE